MSLETFVNKAFFSILFVENFYRENFHTFVKDENAENYDKFLENMGNFNRLEILKSLNWIDKNIIKPTIITVEPYNPQEVIKHIMNRCHIILPDKELYD